MFDVNRVTLVGRLGAKPEIKTNEKGDSWTWLRVATNGSSEDSPAVWHSVIVFNAQAENCVQYLDKGSRIYIEGKIKSSTRQGEEYPQNSVSASRVIFLGPKSGAMEESEAC